jgi:hypothetical protein
LEEPESGWGGWKWSHFPWKSKSLPKTLWLLNDKGNIGDSDKGLCIFNSSHSMLKKTFIDTKCKTDSPILWIFFHAVIVRTKRLIQTNFRTVGTKERAKDKCVLNVHNYYIIREYFNFVIKKPVWQQLRTENVWVFLSVWTLKTHELEYFKLHV